MTPTATVRILAMALVIALLPTASVADPADEPAYVAWPDLLPGLTTAYDPSSSNLCTAGHVRCVDAVIREATAGTWTCYASASTATQASEAAATCGGVPLRRPYRIVVVRAGTAGLRVHVVNH